MLSTRARGGKTRKGWIGESIRCLVYSFGAMGFRAIGFWFMSFGVMGFERT